MSEIETAHFPEISHPKKRAFLVAYSELGNRTQAAKAAGIDRRNHSNWMRDDEQYREAFEEAHEQACEALEREAHRRAVEGIEEPVYYKGVRVDTVKKYSDQLLVVLLNANLPDKFGRYRAEHRHTGHDGGPIQVDHTHRLTKEERKQHVDALLRERHGQLHDKHSGNGKNGS